MLTIVRNTAYGCLRKTRAYEPVAQFDEEVHLRQQPERRYEICKGSEHCSIRWVAAGNDLERRERRGKKTYRAVGMLNRIPRTKRSLFVEDHSVPRRPALDDARVGVPHHIDLTDCFSLRRRHRCEN